MEVLTLCLMENHMLIEDMRHAAYLQTLLEAGGLVLGVLGDGGVGAAALAGPGLAGTTGVPVLVSRLLHLSPHLYCLLCVSLHKRLRGKQPQVWEQSEI